MSVGSTQTHATTLAVTKTTRLILTHVCVRGVAFVAFGVEPLVPNTGGKNAGPRNQAADSNDFPYGFHLLAFCRGCLLIGFTHYHQAAAQMERPR